MPSTTKKSAKKSSSKRRSSRTRAPSKKRNSSRSRVAKKESTSRDSVHKSRKRSIDRLNRHRAKQIPKGPWRSLTYFTRRQRKAAPADCFLDRTNKKYPVCFLHGRGASCTGLDAAKRRARIEGDQSIVNKAERLEDRYGCNNPGKWNNAKAVYGTRVRCILVGLGTTMTAATSMHNPGMISVTMMMAKVTTKA